MRPTRTFAILAILAVVCSAVVYAEPTRPSSIKLQTAQTPSPQFANSEPLPQTYLWTGHDLSGHGNEASFDGTSAVHVAFDSVIGSGLPAIWKSTIGLDGSVENPQQLYTSTENVCDVDAAAFNSQSTLIAWCENTGGNQWAIKSAIFDNATGAITEGPVVVYAGNFPPTRIRSASRNGMMALLFQEQPNNLILYYGRGLSNLQRVVVLNLPEGVTGGPFDVTVSNEQDVTTVYVVYAEEEFPRVYIEQWRDGQTRRYIFFNALGEVVHDITTAQVGADLTVANAYWDRRSNSCHVESTVVNDAQFWPYFPEVPDLGETECYNPSLGIASAGNQGTFVSFNGPVPHGGGLYGVLLTPRGWPRAFQTISRARDDHDALTFCKDSVNNIVCQIVFRYTPPSEPWSVWRAEARFPQNGPTGGLIGTAYVDLNGNGEPEAGEELRNYDVCVRSATGQRYQTSTDGNGIFQFENVPVGTYRPEQCYDLAGPVPFRGLVLSVEPDVAVEGNILYSPGGTSTQQAFLPWVGVGPAVSTH